MISSQTINVYGLGHVGLASALVAAQSGHRVRGFESSADRFKSLEAGKMPFFEPGLSDDILQEVLESGTFEVRCAPIGAEIHLVCVGTPASGGGDLDTSQIATALPLLAQCLNQSRNIIPWVLLRSTVPPGLLRDYVLPQLEHLSGLKHGHDFWLGVYPEFMREGSALEDILRPPLNVVGMVEGLPPKGHVKMIEAIFSSHKPLQIVTESEAALVKLASNTFHALKISFANEIGRLASRLGIDGHKVMQIFRSDEKLNCSAAYLKPGFSFGGPCLSKDVSAVCEMAERENLALPLIQRILPSNQAHHDSRIQEILKQGWETFAVIGLSFKPNTSDRRGSPMTDLLQSVAAANSVKKIYVYDPLIIKQKDRPDLPTKCEWCLELADLEFSCEGIVLGAYILTLSEQTRIRESNLPILDLGFQSFNAEISSGMTGHKLNPQSSSGADHLLFRPSESEIPLQPGAPDTI